MEFNPPDVRVPALLKNCGSNANVGLIDGLGIGNASSNSVWPESYPCEACLNPSATTGMKFVRQLLSNSIASTGVYA